METVVVDAVRLGNGQNAQPIGLVHRRITGQREQTAIVLAPQEDRSAVDFQAVTLFCKIAHAEVDRSLIAELLVARSCFKV